MIIPDETDLFWLFGSQAELLDQCAPQYYNTMTYTYTNQFGETLILIIKPSLSEVKIEVKETNQIISEIQLEEVISFEILYDHKQESQLMITTDHHVFIIAIKPRFKLFIS